MAVSLTLVPVLVIVCTLCVLLPVCDSCMCSGPRTLQEHYCQSAFVIKTKILKKKAIFDKNSMIPEIPVAIKYTAKTLKVFKLDERNMSVKINEHEVYTGATSCGRQFNIGKVYAIAGRIRDGQLWAEMCEFATQWSDLSPHQVKFIRWKYRKHCGCSVQIEGRHRAPKPHCSTSSNEWLCYAKHSYCEVRPQTARRSKCRWQMNKPVRDCLRKLEP